MKTIEAGNLYVNRGITGAIVERQPFGGFKRSSVGWGLKAGGRNYLMQFGRFVERSSSVNTFPTLVEESVTNYLKQISTLIKTSQEMTWLYSSASSDAFWNKSIYSRDKYDQGLEKGNLTNEANYHRYLPLPNVIVRVSRSASITEVARVVMAAKLSGTAIELSLAKSFVTSNNLTRLQLQALTSGFRHSLCEKEDFNPAVVPGTKLILVGPREARISELQENPDLFVFGNEIIRSGRITLLSLMREQSIAITQHRFGAIQSELVNIL